MSVTIINGGTQGLGEATARELAGRGATGLVIAGRSAERGAALAAELSATGTPTVFLEAEMEDVDAPERIVAACDERFGVVHGVVNVAAMTDRSTVWDATPEHWDRMMAINVRAPFFVLQRAAELMRREGVRGSVVNIGSVCAHGGPTRLLAYSVSKGALAVMTKSAAFSLMRHGIRVNQINPGWMDTESEDLVQRGGTTRTDGLARTGGGDPAVRPADQATRAGQGDRVLPVRRRVGDDDRQRRRLRPDGRRRRLRARPES